MTNADLEKLHKIVTEVRNAEERRKRYMWVHEWEAMIRDEGVDEGMAIAGRLNVRPAIFWNTKRIRFAFSYM